MSEVPPALADAYARCLRLARDHYENFPVASKLLPAAMRPHVAAVYAFARTADDFADEGVRPPAERLALLDDWQGRLTATIGARTAAAPSDDRDAIFVALAHTIGAHDLPVSLFEDLLSAFRQDVTVHRYATWDELRDYCRRSADPVGRIVLRIARCWSPDRQVQADCVCTALQVINFLQDFDQDWRNGRLYLPAEIADAHGAREADLGGSRLPAAWRAALAEMGGRARDLMREGRSVCDAVSGRLRYELRATWLGGIRVLDRLERTEYDPVMCRPTIGPADYGPILWQTITWKPVAR